MFIEFENKERWLALLLVWKQRETMCLHEQIHGTLGTSMATSLMALGFTTDMAHWRSCRVTVTVPISCWSDGWWDPPSARLNACKPVESGFTHVRSLTGPEWKINWQSKKEKKNVYIRRILIRLDTAWSKSYTPEKHGLKRWKGVVSLQQSL